MKQYLDLVRQVLDEGEVRHDRTGVGTKSIFGAQLRFDLRQGFPLLTTKKVLFDSVVKELLWFLRGESNINTLGCGIWDEWATPLGELGPIYGHQWRRWGAPSAVHATPKPPYFMGVDQIAHLVSDLKHNPQSRRHIVSAWNVKDLPDMALPPCHLLFQCYVSGDGHLDLQLYQRSADMALGVPFNIASYALLTHILGAVTGLTPRYLIHTFGDAHVYLNHEAGLRKQLKRDLRTLPTLAPLPIRALPEQYTEADIKVLDYNPHPFIKFEVAV